MAVKTVVIASVHERNRPLEAAISKKFADCVVHYIDKKDDLSARVIEKINPDYIFLPHWSWKIPSELYEGYNCVIFHMTDLPYGRGGSPLQNLIARGHRETVVCGLRCVEEMDAGPIYTRRRLSLDGTAEEILLRASALVEEMIVEIIEHAPIAQPQSGEIVHFKRRTPGHGNLAQATSLDQVYDLIRMLDANGYPKAFLELGELRLEFSGARIDTEFVDAKVRIVRTKNA